MVMFLMTLLLLTQCYRISQNPVGVPKEPYETPGDIEDNSLNDIYSDCAARGSVNNTNISNSIGSVRNLFTLFELNDDLFNDEFFTFENYKWKEWTVVLDISKIVDVLLKTLDTN